MKLPVLSQNSAEQEKSCQSLGLNARKLLRKRVVIPVLACVLAGAFALRLAGGGQSVSAARQS